MPVPNIYEDTSATHGTGALSVPWGTHNDTFAAVIVITSNGETISQPTSADATWTLIAEAYEGTPGAAGSIGIAAYWARAVSGSMANVTVADTGDHTSAKMFMLQNVASSGNPINFADTQTVATATASISFACPSSTVNNCLVFCLAGHAIDTGTPPGGSGWANSSLTSVGFGGQYTTTNGNGGGYMGGVGSKTTAGACGTFTHTWAGGATKQANIVFAISDTATAGGSPGSSAGVATATAVGGSIFAGVGAAAGVATAAAVGAAGNIGEAAGVATAAATGLAIQAAVGSAAGVATAGASSTEVRIVDVPGTTPGSVSTGNWPVSVLDAGKYKWQWTPALASTDGYYTGYHAMISSGASSGYGWWLVNGNLELYDTSDNQIFTQAITFSANAPITFIADLASVPNSITISGATTGNGTYTFTDSSPYFEAGTLWIGQWTTGQYTLSGTFSDIFEVTGAPDGDAAGVATATAVGGAIFAGVGSAAGVATATAVGEEATLDFDLGVVASARQLFGASATSATTTGETTQASGSTFLICTGGRLTDLATAPTDNKSNTYTALGSAEEYADWPGYGVRMWKCVNGTGGSSHTFTQTMTIFDEVSIVAVEITDCLWIEDDAIIERAEGSSIASPDVTSLAEAHVVFFLSGDAVTGTTATITPNNGFTIIDDATGVDHPNGYVPIVALHAYKSTAGTYNTTSTISPTQGAIVAGAALQRAQIAAGAGSSAGVATATAVGAATTAAAGAADGVATAAATGAATTAAVGAADGVATATAAGLGVSAGVGGAADGVATAAATGAATFAGVGAADGVATAAAVGAATTAGAGAAAGVATAAATGAATMAGAGAADGVATAAATGQAVAAGAVASDGVATAAATGAATTAGVGVADGSATAAAGGEAVFAAVGSAAGTAEASAASPGLDPGAGAADGSATAAAVGGAIFAGVGAADGVATAAAAGGAVSAAAGASAGVATASGVGAATTASVGAAAGIAAASAVGAATTAGVGAADGAATAAATSEEGGTSGAGAAAGVATAAAVGGSIFAAVGSAAGTSTAQASATSDEDLPSYIPVTLLRKKYPITLRNRQFRVRLLRG